MRQINLASQSFLFNVCDVEFLQSAAVHSNIKIKLGVQLSDMLIKVYLENIVWSKCLFGSIQTLIQRFLEHEAYQEFL